MLLGYGVRYPISSIQPLKTVAARPQEEGLGDAAELHAPRSQLEIERALTRLVGALDNVDGDARAGPHDPVEGQARGGMLEAAVEEEAGAGHPLGREELLPRVVGELVEPVRHQEGDVGADIGRGRGTWRLTQRLGSGELRGRRRLLAIGLGAVRPLDWPRRPPWRARPSPSGRQVRCAHRLRPTPSDLDVAHDSGGTAGVGMRPGLQREVS